MVSISSASLSPSSLKSWFEVSRRRWQGALVQQQYLEFNMLYCVEMTVSIPRDIPLDEVERIKASEKERAIDIQESGKWPHLWRVVGEYSNISIFDVEGNDELHSLLSSLPLFPFMKIKVTPLAKHPSSIF
jgi:muconolactone D-isomerase